MRRHANPRPTKEGLSHLKRVAKDAYPNLQVRFLGHGDLGGHRAPRDHTIAFRLEDSRGKHRSNVVWVMPQSLTSWTADDVRRAVDKSNGR